MHFTLLHPCTCMTFEDLGTEAPAISFDEQNCAICLDRVQDRCILPKCFHSCFCFACILEWIRTQQGTKQCPMCKTPLGPYILHSLDSTIHEFLVYHIPQQSGHLEGHEHSSTDQDDSSTGDADALSRVAAVRPSISEIRQREERKMRQKQRAALAFRRRVYRLQSYAKHVASNKYTRYRPYPGPTGFRQNPAYARLLSMFLQRELQVWPHVDIPFLSYYIPALLSHLDVTSDAFLERLAEWIGNADDARLLAHEMELFVRSGRGSLGLDQYDTNPWLQYDAIS